MFFCSPCVVYVQELSRKSLFWTVAQFCLDPPTSFFPLSCYVRIYFTRLSEFILSKCPYVFCLFTYNWLIPWGRSVKKLIIAHVFTVFLSFNVIWRLIIFTESHHRIEYQAKWIQFTLSQHIFLRPIVTCPGFAWWIITGSGFDDRIYWHFYYNYNQL
jgi:hypothetical protein